MKLALYCKKCNKIYKLDSTPETIETTSSEKKESDNDSPWELKEVDGKQVFIRK